MSLACNCEWKRGQLRVMLSRWLGRVTKVWNWGVAGGGDRRVGLDLTLRRKVYPKIDAVAVPCTSVHF